MAKPVTWIVVADAGRARVFETSGAQTNLALTAKPWGERHAMIAALPPSREIDTDKPGRSFDSGGEGRHALEPPTDPNRHAKENFAREVVHSLDSSHRQGEFDDLVLVAPPMFLGDLRSIMPDGLRDRVRLEVGKDFSKLSEPDLRQRIGNDL